MVGIYLKEEKLNNLMIKDSTTQNIQQVISSTMDKVNMDVEIRKDCSGVNMSYNFIGHYIGFDEIRLIEAKEEMSFPISLESYIKILTIHELGHAIDRQNLMDTIDRTMEIFELKYHHTSQEIYTNRELLATIIEEHEMNIGFEITAWENAEKLNRQYGISDEITLQAVKDHSLSTYINLYNMDVALFHKLTKTGMHIA